MATVMDQKREFPLWIGDEPVVTGKTRTISIPYDGTPLAEVYEADEPALERAVAAAEEGARAMAVLSLYERAEILDRLRGLLARDAEEFARVIADRLAALTRDHPGEL